MKNSVTDIQQGRRLTSILSWVVLIFLGKMTFWGEMWWETVMIESIHVGADPARAAWATVLICSACLGSRGPSVTMAETQISDWLNKRNTSMALTHTYTNTHTQYVCVYVQAHYEHKQIPKKRYISALKCLLKSLFFHLFCIHAHL